MRNGTFFRPHRSSTENMRLFRCSLAITRTTQVGAYFIIYIPGDFHAQSFVWVGFVLLVHLNYDRPGQQ